MSRMKVCCRFGQVGVLRDSIDEDALPTLIALLERGISLSRQASDLIDQSLRLEKFLASVVCPPLEIGT